MGKSFYFFYAAAGEIAIFTLANTQIDSTQNYSFIPSGVDAVEVRKLYDDWGTNPADLKGSSLKPNRKLAHRPAGFFAPSALCRLHKAYMADRKILK